MSKSRPFFKKASTFHHLLSISVFFCWWYWPKYLFVLSMCKLTFLYWVCWLYSPILQRHKIPFLVPLWRSLWENKTHRIKVTWMISCCQMHILSKYSHGQKGWNSNTLPLFAVPLSKTKKKCLLSVWNLTSKSGYQKTRSVCRKWEAGYRSYSEKTTKIDLLPNREHQKTNWVFAIAFFPGS